jgi:glucan phosphoethanolaminetransferase (alkaline phosphatase superfamily)
MFYQKPGVDLVVLVHQTNIAESLELVYGLKGRYAFFTILYLLTYLVAVRGINIQSIVFKKALTISIVAITILVGEYVIVNKMSKPKRSTQTLFYFENYYPMGLIYGMYKVASYSKKNSIEQSKNFVFHAQARRNISKRQVYVLIIGESSRYDRWQVNGYTRPTSPRLAKRENLLAFANARSGGNLTAVAVPQIITRADPEHMNLQYKEKSVLAAFKEAGFRTCWLSNQLGRGIFTNGSITGHAKRADFYTFNSYEGLHNEKVNYDERLLPIMDSIIKADTRNLFIVLHTYGSHWDYQKRYPRSFDFFKPSGYTQPIYPVNAGNREAFLNTYDNTIRYADFVIDSAIGIVQRSGSVATLMYLSDHGEDLLEEDPLKPNFHLAVNNHTLDIPFFIWHSAYYEKEFPEKTSVLKSHLGHKIGTENCFYTLLDLANVSFPGFDKTKSIADSSFKESRQLFYIRKE